MQQDFYKEKLIEQGLQVLIPEKDDIEIINDVIFNELCLGKVKEESRKEFSRIITGLKEKGAEAVILGCTEIGLLIQQKDSILPIYDTTIVHAKKAVEEALK